VRIAVGGERMDAGTSPNLKAMLAQLAGTTEGKGDKDVFMAVYCQHCGFIDPNVSKVAVRTVLEITKQEFATITCKQCGQPIPVNLNEDLMKVGKNGKVKLKETSQW
jgi:predicted nucleic-acid-binding Zn-ribbon protein